MKKSTSQKRASENGAASETPSKDFLIAGIGASAGGVQALKEFFENVPADSGVAYVVILHLSPDHDSRLAEVLQATSKIPVTQVKKKVKVEPNHVYVVPPNQHLEMLDGHIGVEPNVSTEERRAPVDIFFRTLAESHDSRAISVVLSGTGADGSMGLKRVKERGGVVFAQNPREAEFSEMPRNSIATELVDQVLNASEIPAKIIAYRDNLGAVEIQDFPESRPEDNQAALREIFAVLRVRTGHDFSNYKHPTVLRRIERRINVRELDSFPAYAEYLKENPDEPVALLKDLLISVTNFFRDKEAFAFLETDVVPRILQDKTSQDQIRVWVAGCATGEEAYSLAMLFAEHIEANPTAPAVQIFATDIDDAAIAVARDGFYTLNDAADVAPERLRRFFIKEGDGFRVRRELREMILFASHNLLKNAPFSHLDLVTCRNLLIYFNAAAQERAMETFHFALNPGAFLFLGTSESIDGAGDLYAPLSKEHHVYQSRLAVAKTAYPVPDAPPALRYAEPKTLPAPLAQVSQERETRLLERISFGDLHQQLLEQYAPPSVVVNENYDIVHLSARAGRFLHVAGGEPSKNLLQLIRPELRLELRAALLQAVQRRANAEAANLKVQTGGRTETINIQVRPVLRQEDTARGFLLVLFEPSSGDGGAEKTAAERVAAGRDETLALRLETELEKTKAQLRTTVEQFEVQTEELRASNEELQAMNEELRSTAEELETSREELQSVNEELLTVNQELKIKIEEMTLTNSYLQNLMNSTDLATIFLDRKLCVRLFTPATSSLFNLIQKDIGRPLLDITNQLEDVDILADAETVLETLQTVEREVRTTDDRFYTMRVLPYRTTEDKINGVVVTFYEVTERRRMEEAKFFLASIVESSKDSMLTINFDRIITSWNRAAETLYGYTAGEAIGKPLTMLTLPEDFVEILGNVEKIKRGEAVEIFDTFRLNKDGREMHLEVVLSPVKDAADKIIGVSTIARDVTERRRAEEAIHESEKRFRAFVTASSDAVYRMNADWTEMRSLVGKNFLPDTEHPNRSWLETYIHADDRARVLQAVGEAVETKSVFELEHRVARADGTPGWTQSRAVPLLDEAGEITEWFGTAHDVTTRKFAEEALRVSHERQHFVLESAKIGEWEMDLTTRQARHSFIHDQCFGATEPFGEWSYDIFLTYVHPDDRPEVERRFGEAIERRKEWNFECRVVWADQSVHWIQAVGYFYRNGGENPTKMLGIVSDITERKQAEERLRESEERFRAMFEQANVGIVQINVDGQLLLPNHGFCKIIGYSADETAGLNVRDITHPDDYERETELTRQLLAGEIPGYSIEKRYICKDGGMVWANMTATVVRSPAHKPLYVVAIVEDITERKQAEESISFQAKLLDTVEQSVIATDMDGEIIFWNQFAEKLYGWTAEEVRGRNIGEITTPEKMVERAAKIMSLLAEGKSWSGEFEVKRRDGATFPAHVFNSPITDGAGKSIGIVGVSIDITERKQAEQALAKSEERLRLLIESASDYAILTVTKDNTIESWNTGAERTFGWKETEIVGKSGEILFTPEDRSAGVPEKEIECAAETGKAEDERWHIRKDGSRFYASGVMQPLRNDVIHGFVKICRDQTERIEAEKAIHDKEMMQRLMSAQEDERKRIARDLHDELGQQLTALRLKLDATKKVCEETEICGKIDEIQLIAKQIDADVDFLAWELRPASLDDLGLIVSIENYVREWSRHAGVAAEFHASGLKRRRFAPEIETNLYRVAQEALNNVHKHAQAQKASVLLEKRGDAVVLIVEDDGKGFKPKSKNVRAKGIGLIGMSERAAICGGSLEIESSPGKGATVYVRVPLSISEKEKK